MDRRPMMPEAGGARLAAQDTRLGRPGRLGFGVVASLALHAGAAAAVATALAWRAAPVAPPPESAVQVFWLDARPPAEPDPSPPAEPSRPPREAASPAAPMGESATEGLEPEDLLATMLPDPVAPPPPLSGEPPAVAAASSPPPPTLSELLAAAGLAVPEPADPPTGADFAAPPHPPAAEEVTAPAERSAALAALAVPPPAPPSRAAPPSAAGPAPAKRERSQPPRPPNAAVVPARPSQSPPPRTEAAALAPQPSAAPEQVPLVGGPPRFRRPPSPPEYPAQARDRGDEGSVGLRLLVGADGATREVRLHRSSGIRLLDEAALAAARRWEVEPASIGGRRAEAWVEVPVRFRLER